MIIFLNKQRVDFLFYFFLLKMHHLSFWHSRRFVYFWRFCFLHMKLEVELTLEFRWIGESNFYHGSIYKMRETIEMNNCSTWLLCCAVAFLVRKREKNNVYWKPKSVVVGDDIRCVVLLIGETAAGFYALKLKLLLDWFLIWVRYDVKGWLLFQKNYGSLVSSRK